MKIRAASFGEMGPARGAWLLKCRAMRGSWIGCQPIHHQSTVHRPSGGLNEGKYPCKGPSAATRRDIIPRARNRGTAEEVLVMWRGGKTLDYTAEMRHAEFRSVAETLGVASSQIDFQDGIAPEMLDGISLTETVNPTFDPRLWQFISGISIDEAERVASRCAIVRRLHEVIAFGTSASECAKAAAVYPIATHPRAAGLALGDTWRLRWKPVRGPSSEAKRSGRGRAPLPTSLLGELAPFTDKLPGDVDLSRPQHVFYVLEGHFLLPGLLAPNRAGPREDVDDRNSDGDGACVLITLEATTGLDIHPFVLSQRGYLSTSTMHHEVAFIMANMACVDSGSSVCDPFCGSGGILLAAAAVGAAVTVGVDVDPTLDEDGIRSNFIQYSLPPLNRLIRGDIADAGTIDGAISANSGKPFDAIISDPPYGRRERTISALGASDGQIRKSRMQLAAIDAAVVLTRLCASRDDFLRQGGRLVYFLPTNTDCTQEQLVLFIPTHPALRLVEVCRQPINQRLIRWLIVLEKTHCYGEIQQAAAQDVFVRPGIEDVVGYDFEGLLPEDRTPSDGDE